ncbi:hypothetical protein H6G41_22345 [Tolypothrix sp. FACHB-123]|uniref:hypothetical protein n=1 Tax=Tolypothrix sp. FACHB-123 TaxID=2692868 RepID=UPI00199CE6A1|nr:hypothetical protein [Tolypothrix sp. FACHB-123]MBD2357326.1 hypothetical protein [Tolypothrix sp. FACHB-123]
MKNSTPKGMEFLGIGNGAWQRNYQCPMPQALVQDVSYPFVTFFLQIGVKLKRLIAQYGSVSVKNLKMA